MQKFDIFFLTSKQKPPSPPNGFDIDFAWLLINLSCPSLNGPFFQISFFPSNFEQFLCLTSRLQGASNVSPLQLSDRSAILKTSTTSLVPWPLVAWVRSGPRRANRGLRMNKYLSHILGLLPILAYQKMLVLASTVFVLTTLTYLKRVQLIMCRVNPLKLFQELLKQQRRDGFLLFRF